MQAFDEDCHFLDRLQIALLLRDFQAAIPSGFCLVQALEFPQGDAEQFPRGGVSRVL